MRSIFQSLNGFFIWVWRFLTEPFETLPKPEDRTRAVFASAFLLFSAIAVAIEQASAGNTPLIALILLIIGYFLARTRGFKIATFLLIFTLTFPSYLVALRQPNPEPNQLISTFVWIIVPLLISSLVYSVRTTAIIGMLNFLALNALSLIHPELDYRMIGGALGFYGLFAMILITVMIQRNQIENDRQKELIESHDELSREVAQRKRFAEQAQRRADQLVMLNEVSYAISNQKSLEKVLELIFEKTKDVIPLNVFYVALYDKNTASVSFPIMFDNGKRWEDQTISLKKANRIAKIIQSGKPLLLNRTLEEIEESQKTDTRLGDQSQTSVSAMMAPLQLGTRIIGVISAQSYSMDIYNDDHLSTLTALAHQVVVAIENVRLFEQTAKRAQRLSILNEIGREISTLADLPALMENVYRQIDHVLSTDFFFISLYNKEKQELSFPLMYDAGRRWKQDPTPVTDDTFSGKTILTRKPVLVNNWADPEQGDASPPLLVGDDSNITKSLMFVPILWGSETLGVISVQSYSAGAYHEEDLNLLSGIAHQVAIAIQNTRLLEETKQNARHLSILNEVGRAVSKIMDLPDLLETVYEQGKNSILLDAFFVGLYHPETHEISFPIIFDGGKRYNQDSGPISISSFLNRFLAGEKTILINRTPEELAKSTPALTALGEKDKRSASIMAVPLISRNEIVGLISAQSYSLNAYDEKDVELLKGIASQVAIAIENSRLFAATQQEIKERQRAEMEAQKERDFALQVMNALGQGVSVSLLDGVYEYVNPAYAQMLGYKPEDMIGEVSDHFALPDETGKYTEERTQRQLGKTTT
ncbi:MAG TPA: GAF domain-containing protein, partial [Anaerolineales bacterium]|nr:GAF domain-containing protein [Anaerolineales bacterium]